MPALGMCGADSHIEIKFPDVVIHRLANSRECVICMCETKITVVAHSLLPAQFCGVCGVHV